VVSDARRRRFGTYGLLLLGLVSIWVGSTSGWYWPFLFGGVALVGGVVAIVRGFTHGSIALLSGGIALSGLVGLIHELAVDGLARPFLVAVFLLVVLPAGYRATTYWRARP